MGYIGEKYPHGDDWRRKKTKKVCNVAAGEAWRAAGEESGAGGSGGGSGGGPGGGCGAELIKDY